VDEQATLIQEQAARLRELEGKMGEIDQRTTDTQAELEQLRLVDSPGTVATNQKLDFLLQRIGLVFPSSLSASSSPPLLLSSPGGGTDGTSPSPDV
jgi:hypothetical protein